MDMEKRSRWNAPDTRADMEMERWCELDHRHLFWCLIRPMSFLIQSETGIVNPFVNDFHSYTKSVLTPNQCLHSDRWTYDHGSDFELLYKKILITWLTHILSRLKLPGTSQIPILLHFEYSFPTAPGYSKLPRLHHMSEISKHGFPLSQLTFMYITPLSPTLSEFQ